MAKDYERAAQLQLQFALFPSKWMHYGLGPAMKAAMNLIGVPAGEPYPPYAPLSRDDMAALAAYLKGSVLAPRVAAACRGLTNSPRVQKRTRRLASAGHSRLRWYERNRPARVLSLHYDFISWPRISPPGFLAVCTLT